MTSEQLSKRTATAAMMLALLCLPGLLGVVIESVEHGSEPGAPSGLIVANAVVVIAEAFIFVAGALLLYQHRTAGRWMIAATGGAATLHGLSFIVQLFLTGVSMSAPAATIALELGLMLAVPAAAAMVTALLPSTSRWCQTKRGSEPSARW